MTDTEILDWIESHEPFSFKMTILGGQITWWKTDKYGKTLYITEGTDLRDCVTKAMEKDDEH